MRLTQILFSAVITVLSQVLVCCADTPENSTNPYSSSIKFSPENRIDKLIQEELEKRKKQPANLCTDAVFIRRVYLDVTGTIPEPWEVRNFLDNKNTNKRKVLINQLLKQEAFADYLTLKWCDLLRVKAEFPINLWPNGVQAYARWLHDAVRNNMPYDQFARELLTSSGSNFRVPPVNFYRGVQDEEPFSIASAAALMFMGVRLEKWPEKKQNNMEVFFSRVAHKHTSEWKEIIVYLDPAKTSSLKAVFPDGKTVKIPAGKDPREVFADWLISSDNKWFARNIVNRIWSWLMGRGLIHEPDDIRQDNPAVYPQLLEYLEQELIESDYNLHHIYALILKSSTYQQASILNNPQADSKYLFVPYPVRQLDAEVLLDALCKIFGSYEDYSSVIPEPFTFIPKRNHSVELVDGSITSSFLKMFGRPARDTGLESERCNTPTDEQRLHMLNSTHIHDKIKSGWRLRQKLKNAGGNRKKMLNIIYLTILSRLPTEAERVDANKYFKSGIKGKAANDLFWALINSREFLYQH